MSRIGDGIYKHSPFLSKMFEGFLILMSVLSVFGLYFLGKVVFKAKYNKTTRMIETDDISALDMWLAKRAVIVLSIQTIIGVGIDSVAIFRTKPL